jgi:hypothetical protein
MVIAQDVLDSALSHQTAKRSGTTKCFGMVIDIAARRAQLDWAGLRRLENRLTECHIGQQHRCD